MVAALPLQIVLGRGPDARPAASERMRPRKRRIRPNATTFAALGFPSQPLPPTGPSTPTLWAFAPLPNVKMAIAPRHGHVFAMNPRPARSPAPSRLFPWRKTRDRGAMHFALRWVTDAAFPAFEGVGRPGLFPDREQTRRANMAEKGQRRARPTVCAAPSIPGRGPHWPHALAAAPRIATAARRSAPWRGANRHRCSIAFSHSSRKARRFRGSR